jgi:uncharacterized membrane protein YfcA
VIWQTPLAILSGVPIGFQLGATGAGGALLAVPLLVYVVGTTVQEAAAISLVIVAASALLGVWEYGKAGLVKAKAVAAFSWTGVLGAWGGAYGHHLVKKEVLLLLFGFLLLFARALMIRQSRLLAAAEPESSCAVRFPRTCWLKVAGIGLAIGVLNGVFGVGGGFMIVPALVLILKFPSRLAIGTSLTIISLISIGGIVGHLQFGHLDGRLTALVFLGSAAGILLGARLGGFISPKAMGRTVASITVSLALWLILFNSAKLLGVSL